MDVAVPNTLIVRTVSVDVKQHRTFERVHDTRPRDGTVSFWADYIATDVISCLNASLFPLCSFDWLFLGGAGYFFSSPFCSHLIF